MEVFKKMSIHEVLQIKQLLQVVNKKATIKSLNLTNTHSLFLAKAKILYKDKIETMTVL